MATLELISKCPYAISICPLGLAVTIKIISTIYEDIPSYVFEISK